MRPARGTHGVAILSLWSIECWLDTGMLGRKSEHARFGL